MSIVRVGMSENKGYADGYEAIFGKKTASSSGKAGEPKKSTAAKKPAKKAKKK